MSQFQSFQKAGLQWFDNHARLFLDEAFTVRVFEEEEGGLGTLLGIQFDSSAIGGYCYFWSSGYVGFQYVDYLKEQELVEDTLMLASEMMLNEMLIPLENTLRASCSRLFG